MKSYTSTRKFYAGGSLILGILLLLWPAGALRIAGYAVGFVIMASGIISFLSALRRRKRGYSSGGSLIIGVIVTLVGGWIFVNPENFASIVPTAIGYLIMFNGILNLVETFTLSRAHYGKWWISLLAAVMTIVLGLVLVNHAFGIAAAMARIGGLALLFNGISDLWINRRIDRYAGGRRRASGGTGSARRAQSSAGGSERHDTPGPDVIDAEDYRAL